MIAPHDPRFDDDEAFLSPDEFFKWVGMCIKEWANIESRLYDLCALILKADPKHVAIVYYRTRTSMRGCHSQMSWCSPACRGLTAFGQNWSRTFARYSKPGTSSPMLLLEKRTARSG
jgi:hypothetical protein